ncbi:T-cell leukemia/lymphoma protein 1A [Puma concolor]|uniref:T-cell leukemia/lymphoma protein 1A n=1 Tax=Puma concolor TaxID=9696 RepID=A0A6P6HHD1_PUMCO|nr:T-cell leukemia/lymphoma protein 1A [Puma concolor]
MALGFREVSSVLLMESSLQVLMRQEDVLLGEAVCPGLLAPGLLPSMWQLYPGRRYRGSDSSFWRVVYHIEFSGTEEMLLEQLPDPEYE